MSTLSKLPTQVSNLSFTSKLILGVGLTGLIVSSFYKAFQVWRTSFAGTSSFPKKPSKLHIEPKTQKELAEKLVDWRILRNKNAIEVYSTIDRKNFVDWDELKNALGNGMSTFSPYGEHALPLGNNATMSSPHIHALALDLLAEKAREGMTVLDIGSGSGYMTACLAMLVGNTGSVVAIEHISELVSNAEVTLSEHYPELFSRIKMSTGDGLVGNETFAPYQLIYIGAAVGTVDDLKPLLLQLGKNGRMIVPVGMSEGFQRLLQIDHLENGELKIKDHGVVRFVPIFSSPSQQKNSHITSTPAFPVKVKDDKTILVKSYVVPAPDSTAEDYQQLREFFAKKIQEQNTTES